jgi:hypothetical protein
MYFEGFKSDQSKVSKRATTLVSFNESYLNLTIEL